MDYITDKWADLKLTFRRPFRSEQWYLEANSTLKRQKSHKRTRSLHRKQQRTSRHRQRPLSIAVCTQTEQEAYSSLPYIGEEEQQQEVVPSVRYPAINRSLPNISDIDDVDDVYDHSDTTGQRNTRGQYYPKIDRSNSTRMPAATTTTASNTAMVSADVDVTRQRANSDARSDVTGDSSLSSATGQDGQEFAVLTVVLPDGSEYQLSCEASKPMMDVLIQITSDNKLSASDYKLQEMSEKKGWLCNYNASQPIGKCKSDTLYLISKSEQKKNNAVKPKVSHQFAVTSRFVVNLPHQKTLVLRLSQRTTLAEIYQLVCEQKRLDAYKHEFRHPTEPDRGINMAATIAEQRLSSITMIHVNGESQSNGAYIYDPVMVKSDTVSPSTEGTYMPSEGGSKKKKGFFSFFRSKKGSTKFKPQQSMGDEFVSVRRTHTDEVKPRPLTIADAPSQTIAKQQPVKIKEAPKVETQQPIKPIRKKRAAPAPPTPGSVGSIPETDTTDANCMSEMDGSCISIPSKSDRVISSNSSHSSGFEENAKKNKRKAPVIPPVASPAVKHQESTELEEESTLVEDIDIKSLNSDVTSDKETAEMPISPRLDNDSAIGGSTGVDDIDSLPGSHGHSPLPRPATFHAPPPPVETPPDLSPRSEDQDYDGPLDERTSFTEPSFSSIVEERDHESDVIDVQSEDVSKEVQEEPCITVAELGLPEVVDHIPAIAGEQRVVETIDDEVIEVEVIRFKDSKVEDIKVEEANLSEVKNDEAKEIDDEYLIDEEMNNSTEIIEEVIIPKRKKIIQTVYEELDKVEDDKGTLPSEVEEVEITITKTVKNKNIEVVTEPKEETKDITFVEPTKPKEKEVLIFSKADVIKSRTSESQKKKSNIQKRTTKTKVDEEVATVPESSANNHNDDDVTMTHNNATIVESKQEDVVEAVKTDRMDDSALFKVPTLPRQKNTPTSNRMHSLRDHHRSSSPIQRPVEHRDEEATPPSLATVANQTKGVKRAMSNLSRFNGPKGWGVTHHTEPRVKDIRGTIASCQQQIMKSASPTHSREPSFDSAIGEAKTVTRSDSLNKGASRKNGSTKQMKRAEWSKNARRYTSLVSLNDQGPAIQSAKLLNQTARGQQECLTASNDHLSTTDGAVKSKDAATRTLQLQYTDLQLQFSKWQSQLAQNQQVLAEHMDVTSEQGGGDKKVTSTPVHAEVPSSPTAGEADGYRRLTTSKSKPTPQKFEKQQRPISSPSPTSETSPGFKFSPAELSAVKQTLQPSNKVSNSMRFQARTRAGSPPHDILLVRSMANSTPSSPSSPSSPHPRPSSTKKSGAKYRQLDAPTLDPREELMLAIRNSTHKKMLVKAQSADA